MRLIFALFICILLFPACASRRYMLNDNGLDKRFLADAIKVLAGTGQITRKPIVVIDGKAYRFTKELKEAKLKIAKKDIEKLNVMEASLALKTYGNDAKAGVVIVTLKRK